MINFKKISIEGFTSIVEPFTLELDKGGLNIIRGKVGSGKTTIPNALTWALYGQSLKLKSSIETWEELRPENYRGVKVNVELEKEGDIYNIIRCKSFKGNITVGHKTKMKGANNIMVLKNGELVGGKGKVLAQKEIQSIIGYSFELFKNSIVFGQKMKRIIEETGPEKKKVFEEAFDVGFVEMAKDNTNAEKGKLVNLKKDFIHDLEVVDERISKYQRSYEFALENETNFNDNINNNLKEYKDNIKETKAELNELLQENNKLVNIEKLEATKKTLENELKVITTNNNLFINSEADIFETQRSIKKLEGERKVGFELCPTCGGKLNRDKAKDMGSKLLNKLKEKKQSLKELEKIYMGIEHIDISPTKKNLEAIVDKISQAKATNKYVENSTNRIKRFEERIQLYNDKIEELRSRKLKVKSLLYDKLTRKLNKESRSIKRKLDKIEKEIEIKNWLINDPLSSNGLKAYIFDSLLGNINDRLDSYEPILGFQIEFGIDLDSHRKDFYQAIMKDNIVIAYEDLSGGQQQLVNTAVAFAIHDVISSMRPLNILFLDEPFESLDADYIDVVSELVYEKSKDKTLYLITHHQSFTATNTNDIHVTQINGHTQIN